MTTLDTRPETADLRGLRTAAHLLFALLVCSQLAVVGFLLWEPPFDGGIRYDDIDAVRGAYWPAHVLVAGPGFAIAAMTGTVFLVVLGAGRGRVLALVGAVVHLLAGVVFALVVTAESLPYAWALDRGIMTEEQGRALVASYNDHLDRYAPYVLGSMGLIALGALVALAGAALSGSVGWWVPAVAVVLIAGLFGLPIDSPLQPVLDLGQRLLWVYLGWRGLRRMLARA